MLKPAPGPAFWPGFILLTITIVQLTIHCRQHYTAQSVTFCCVLLPNTALCCPGTAQSRSCARFGAARASNSGWKALLIKWKVSTAATTNGGLGVGFLGVVGGCRESLLGEQWNVVVFTNIQHMQTKLSETTRCKTSLQISKQSRPRTHRAARTIEDFTDGREWALSMTSLMDATEGGRQQIGPLALSMTPPMDARGHYRWLHRWMPQREGNKTIWSKLSKTTEWKQSEANNSIQWQFQSRKFFDAIMSPWSWASTGNKFEVGGQPEKTES